MKELELQVTNGKEEITRMEAEKTDMIAKVGLNINFVITMKLVLWYSIGDILSHALFIFLKTSNAKHMLVLLGY